MIKLLFLCHGNICRSPMAEFIMKDLVKKAGCEREFFIFFCAVSREEIGNDMYPPAKRKLTEKGVPFAKRAARQITEEDYENFDCLIYMDAQNRRLLTRFFPNAPAQKMRSLLSFTGSDADVADPWYTDDFETAYQDILRGCQALLSYCKKHLSLY